jgi:hypothetical protein
MQVVKFVTKDFKSPGDYGKLDYSGFGIPIEVETDPKDYGQCGRGIHVIPINEDADFEKVIFTETMILLEVEECDIVYCEGNGKMRVCKATPIRQVTESDKEWKIIRKAACNEPGYAVCYARDVGKEPTDETRTAACKNPEYAYMYARDVDKGSTDETRTAACQDSGYAYYYARDIDKKPTEETRKAACNEPLYAYMYARYIDKKYTEETRIGTSKDEYWKEQYELLDNEFNL